MNDHIRVTLQSILVDPGPVTFSVSMPRTGILRPLSASQETQLAAFFDALSSQTRRFYSVTDGRSLAHAHCTSIARYDKLRLVLQDVSQGVIVALVEFSLDLTGAEVERFATYGISISPERACRWGLCVADKWQRQGVGRELASASFAIARRFGRECVILWGGVHAENANAVQFYRTVGFMEAGRFTNDDGVACIDMLRLGEMAA